MLQIKNYNNTTVIVSYVLGLMFLLCLSSCDPGVVFADSNPPGVETIDQIPEPFLGSFVCSSDSAFIHIKSRSIIRETKYQLISSLDDVRDSENCAIVDGGLHVPGRDECFPFEYITDDTIMVDLYTLDTVFIFDEIEELKYHEELLFLNTKLTSGNWMTWTLQLLDDGSLSFELVTIPADEDIVKDLSANYDTDVLDRDKPQYILSPTMEEFDYILSHGFRSTCEILTPINIENDYPEARLF